MEKRDFGKTGLRVSLLGFGLYEIRSLAGSAGAEEAGRLLNAALDAGINFLDTAGCYGNSEELIGGAVAHRRDEYVLATKCGDATDGLAARPWTAEAVEESINRSLRRLKTDRLDLVQLHSCGADVLQQGDVTDALVRARDAGKTRFIGYSGDEDAALWAIESGIFDALQTSLNIVDQHAHSRLLKPAEKRGMGVIIKRPVANVAWSSGGASSSLPGDYPRRWQAIAEPGPIPGAPQDPIHLALGFVFAHPEVDTAIVGTSNLSHLRSNIELMERGVSIPSETVEELHSRFDELDDHWTQRM